MFSSHQPDCDTDSDASKSNESPKIVALDKELQKEKLTCEMFPCEPRMEHFFNGSFYDTDEDVKRELLRRISDMKLQAKSDREAENMKRLTKSGKTHISSPSSFPFHCYELDRLTLLNSQTSTAGKDLNVEKFAWKSKSSIQTSLSNPRNFKNEGPVKRVNTSENNKLKVTNIPSIHALSEWENANVNLMINGERKVVPKPKKVTPKPKKVAPKPKKLPYESVETVTKTSSFYEKNASTKTKRAKGVPEKNVPGTLWRNSETLKTDIKILSSELEHPPDKEDGKFPFNIEAPEWIPFWLRRNTVVSFPKENLIDFGEAYGLEYEFLKDPTVGPSLPKTSHSCHGNYIPVLITEPEAPWNFYVIQKAMLSPLEEMIKEMTDWYDAYQSRGYMKFQDIKVWGYYAAKTLHPPKYLNKWVRVLVTEKPKNPNKPLMNGVECALIDYGGIQFVDCKRLRPLRQVFAQFPWCAYRGCIKTINNKDFKRIMGGGQVEKGFQDMIGERNGEFIGMVVEEIQPDRHNKQPFITWEIFLRNCH